MAVAYRSVGRRARSAGFALLLALAACSATPPATVPSATVPPAHRAPAPAPGPGLAPAIAAQPAPTGPPDPSFDWHNLIVVPFGSERQSLQASLHEVWFFRDDADTGGKSDPEDCYSSDRAAPRFVGRLADHYFLCFRNDRLDRIQAIVILPSEHAVQLFLRFCDTGLKDAPPTAQDAAVCEGQDGAAAFRARLEPAAETSETELSIVVNASALPD
jgi:hypothetical protein